MIYRLLIFSAAALVLGMALYLTLTSTETKGRILLHWIGTILATIGMLALGFWRPFS